jgi:hypothetical protein
MLFFTVKGNRCVYVRAGVSVSPMFLGWMFQFGRRAEIVAAIRELIRENAEMYCDSEK